MTTRTWRRVFFLYSKGQPLVHVVPNPTLFLYSNHHPDGFGSLQGFCGYQLGRNSITLGIHNDADDPQTIAQFGGVRPPLLKVQPKLRVDVEL